MEISLSRITLALAAMLDPGYALAPFSSFLIVES
jgi:hypothetical protein